VETTRCHTTKQWFCEDHIDLCCCHQRAHKTSLLRPDAYAPSALYCRSGMTRCITCDLWTPTHGVRGSCSRCDSAIELSTASVGIQGVFKNFIRPRLPWMMVRTQTLVSGNKDITMFRIHTLTGREHMYRVYLNGDVWASIEGNPWKLLR